MVTQDETTMSQKTKDLSKEKSAKIPDYTAYIIERGERAAMRKLDKAIAEARAEKIKKT